MTAPRPWLARLADTNPIVGKELRGRMRGGRAVVVLTIYLTVLSLFSLLLYWVIAASAASRSPYDQQIGRDLLYGIVIFETLLVMFLAPAFTVGVISGERERQTFDLLMTTLLRARAIVLGKMGAALAFLLLLILAAAPLESLAFVFGGVAPDEVLGSLVVLFFAALVYGSIGIFWSSLMRSTAASTVLTYATMLLTLIGLPFLLGVFTAVLGASGNGGLTSQNAFFIYFSQLLLSTDPLVAMALSEGNLRQGKPLFVFVDTTTLNGHGLLMVQPWLIFCVLALGLSMALLALTTRLLPPVRARRPAIAGVSTPPSAGEAG